ncbi:MAG: hypothetical protein LVQ94_05870 [Thermoplasmatales archaeon]|nr:hypothetical protein [Thermoplasmatales archaeon]
MSLDQTLPNIVFFSLKRLLNQDQINDIISSIPTKNGSFFVLVDAHSIRTHKQVQEAYSRSLRIFEESKKILKPESVFLMLVSGESQISRAIAKSGISPTTKEGYIVHDFPDGFNNFLSLHSEIFDFVADPKIAYDDVDSDRDVFFSMLKVQLKLGL